MKSRMRATAPIRNTGLQSTSSRPQSVHYVSKASAPSTKPLATSSFKCWICQNSDHWIDQCPKLTSMTQPERLKTVKEHHACFSCLKRAGRDHRMANSRRKRQCSEMMGEDQCRYFHHPLLHRDAEQSPPSNAKTHVAFVTDKEVLLPVLTAKMIGPNKGSEKSKKENYSVIERWRDNPVAICGTTLQRELLAEHWGSNESTIYPLL